MAGVFLRIRSTRAALYKKEQKTGIPAPGTEKRVTRMAPAADPDITIFACGNPGRGDDGVGPMLAGRIAALGKAGVTLIEDTALRVEHATEIRATVPVLFVSASVAIERGFVVEKLVSAPDPSLPGHSLSAVGLLYQYETRSGQAAPRAYQLHIAASDFEQGDTLSDETYLAVDAAWRFLHRLLAQPCEAWQQALDGASVAALPGRC